MAYSHKPERERDSESERERERPNKSFYYGDITLGCVSAFDIRSRHFSFISFCKRAQVKSVVDAGGEGGGGGNSRPNKSNMFGKLKINGKFELNR